MNNYASILLKSPICFDLSSSVKYAWDYFITQTANNNANN